MSQPNYLKLQIRWPTLLLLFALVSGCAVKFTADFDSTTYEDTLKTAKLVDRFYGELLETEALKRPYQTYSGRYVEIETELRYLHMRNQARPLNEESTRITANILELWLDYKDRHKQKNTYSDGNAKLDRKRLSRMFIAALSAEEARKDIKH